MVTNKKITIKDVAQAAGVSTQTVSRVLNNRPDVSVKTRARVQQVITDLGYSPNVFARNLSRGHSNTLGVVGYGLNYFGSASVLTGVENNANKLGFSLILSLIDQVAPPRVDAILYDLLSRRVEGIIWAVPGDTTTYDWLYRKFYDLQTPHIFVNTAHSDSDFIVAVNNRRGGRLATEHLLEQGYQNIGIITGPNNWWEANERLAGWRETVEASGTTDLDGMVAEGDWTPPSGDIGLHTLFDRNPEMDAVFVSNDQMALGALQAARRLGLRVPEDLGMVGYDDIPEAAYFYPPLTTVRQNGRDLGALAVDQMKVMIDAQHLNQVIPPQISWVEPRLVIRKSSLRKESRYDAS
jgi:DNA-binding LacI/PurR family transcriptional regulator